MANTHWPYKDDEKVLEFDADASLGIEVGDLMYYDSDDAKPASSQADKLSEPLNQAHFAFNFLGVAKSARLSTDAVAGKVRVLTDGIWEFACTSATFEPGDLVGADEAASGTALEDQSVKKVSYAHLAIGVVVKRYSSATTKVWVRLLSRYCRDIAHRRIQEGTTTLADADVTLTVESTEMLEMTPTAARKIIMPAYAQSKGLKRYIRNLAGATHAINVRNVADDTTIFSIAANKSGIAWCDGVAWHGLGGA